MDPRHRLRPLGTHRPPWDTGFVDLTGDQGLLGRIEGRTGAAVRQRLEEQSQTFRARIAHVVIDPSAAYAAAVTNDLSAYIAKEELRQLLSTARDRADNAEIRTRLYRFYNWCANTNIPELHRLATTIDIWWPAILAFLHTGLTNARTEGYNRLVKQVKRVACGFRNTENSRRRIRFHCTRA